MDAACEEEVQRAGPALRQADFETALRRLERAHVPAQRTTRCHSLVHGRMRVAGRRRGDLREAVGQAPRIVAPLLFPRLWVPRGNSGRARVSAFEPMPVPAELQHLFP